MRWDEEKDEATGRSLMLSKGAVNRDYAQEFPEAVGSRCNLIALCNKGRVIGRWLARAPSGPSACLVNRGLNQSKFG